MGNLFLDQLTWIDNTNIIQPDGTLGVSQTDLTINGAVDEDGNGKNDLLIGNDLDNVIYGGDGDDILLPLDGNNEVWGGNGTDWIWGGAGEDELHGEGDDDFIVGNDGNDELYGGAGDDYMQGDGGDDTLVAGSGDDTMLGGTGDDIFHFDILQGHNKIKDYEAGEDIEIDVFDPTNPGIQTTQVGNDVVITQTGNADFSVTVYGTLEADLDIDII